MSRARRLILFYAMFVLVLFSGACARDDADAVDLFDAYSEIFAAMSFREEQCGSRPAYPLIIPGRPSAYGVRLCSLLILQEPCPFTDYPLFCIEMYTKECEFCDIPGLDP